MPEEGGWAKDWPLDPPFTDLTPFVSISSNDLVFQRLWART